MCLQRLGSCEDLGTYITRDVGLLANLVMLQFVLLEAGCLDHLLTDVAPALPADHCGSWRLPAAGFHKISPRIR